MVVEYNWMPILEVAMFLRMSPSHIYYLCRAQQLPHYRVEGGRIKFDRNAIITWRNINYVHISAKPYIPPVKFLPVRTVEFQDGGNLIHC